MDSNQRLVNLRPLSEADAIIEQRAAWKSSGRRLMVLGFLLELVAAVMGKRSMDGGAVVLLGLIALGGFGLYIYGCMNYARGKGKSMALGLVGFLGIIGLIILLAIKEEPVDDGGFSDTVITWEGDDDSSDGETTITVVDCSN